MKSSAPPFRPVRLLSVALDFLIFLLTFDVLPATRVTFWRSGKSSHLRSSRVPWFPTSLNLRLLIILPTSRCHPRSSKPTSNPVCRSTHRKRDTRSSNHRLRAVSRVSLELRVVTDVKQSNVAAHDDNFDWSRRCRHSSRGKSHLTKQQLCWFYKSLEMILMNVWLPTFSKPGQY